MNTTTVPTPQIVNGEVDMGFLFGYVTATRSGDTVGAHVIFNPDRPYEDAVGDTGLHPIDPDLDPLDVARRIRGVAIAAIVKAGKEIGAPIELADAQRQVMRLLPLAPILEAMVG